MITAEQIQFFEGNGYLKFGKVLEPEEIEALRNGLDRIIRLELEGGDDASIEFKYGHDRRGIRWASQGGGHAPSINTSICGSGIRIMNGPSTTPSLRGLPAHFCGPRRSVYGMTRLSLSRPGIMHISVFIRTSTFGH